MAKGAPDQQAPGMVPGTPVPNPALVDMSGLARARAVAARLAYKRGYGLVVQDSRPRGDGAIAIETDTMIPNAEIGPSVPALTPETWEDPTVTRDLERLDGAAVAFLSAAVNVDRRRLVDAHAAPVAAHVERISEQLAEWCWRKRTKCPGKPRPA
jgi:hypothetical protein